MKMKILNVLFPLCFLLFINTSEAQVNGCTDPLATNYNPSATNNDGSCTYNAANVSPTSSFNLAGNLTETSGLIRWDNNIWTHNDNTDINIYALDSINGAIIQSYVLTGTANIDWEEISQDDAYVYMGDFGNNANGNRTDLKIFKIAKSSILANSPTIETINFSYSDQTNFNPAGANNTDFDCEALIVGEDSIFLFTKQWVSQKTSVYSLPKDPGTYTANLKSTFNVQGLITGATYLESKNLIALSGYSNTLQPFVYLLYDFSGTNFFSGNKRKISISLPFHQVEGIATTNGLKYYISNENFVQLPFLNIPQKLHILDLSTFLSYYLNNLYNFSLLTWNGSSSTDWNTAVNWSPNAKPKASNSVIIPDVTNDPVINELVVSPAVCNNLTIQANAALTIASGKALTVSGIITNSAGTSGLVVKPGGSLIESTPGVSAIVESTFPAGQWHLISAPVTDAKTGLFTGKYLQNHTESTNLYTDITSITDDLTPMKGYAIWGGSAGFTTTYSGTLNSGGIGMADNLTRSGPDNILTDGDDYGWNLVGNPYPSSVDWLAAAGWTKINVDNAIYIHVNDATWAAFVDGSGTNMGSKYIAPGQGFFVHVPGPTYPSVGTLQMSDAVRVHNSTQFFKNSSDLMNNSVRLEISGNNYKDETIVRFLPEATSGFDGEYDAFKLYGDVADAAQIYTLGDSPLSINTLPQINIIPVGIHVAVGGTYTIAVTGVNDLNYVTLEDTKTGNFTDLSAMPYTFNFEAGENEQRFKLHFTPLSDDDTQIRVANIYSYLKTVYVNLNDQVKGDIFIYNILGQLVESKPSAQGMIQLDISKSGNYIVNVVTGKTSMVKKIHIR